MQKWPAVGVIKCGEIDEPSERRMRKQPMDGVCR
jgi:hypothetical protein